MDDEVSTHLGSTPKTSWGDGQRQAGVGTRRTNEEQELEVSNCVE